MLARRTNATPTAMDVAFITDPLPELKAYKDSSIAMMRALSLRGHRIFALGQGDIFWDRNVTRGCAHELTLSADDHDWYRAGEPETRPLQDYTVRVVPYHPGAYLPAELPLIAWQK